MRRSFPTKRNNIKQGRTLSNISCKLLSSWGDDRTIAESAWVSTGIDGNTRNNEDIVRLVHRLARDGHGVPFESVLFRFYIKCPRYIESQILKHRISSINGLSGRYREVPHEWFNLPKLEDEWNMLPTGFREEYSRIADEANSWYSTALQYVRDGKDHNPVGGPDYAARLKRAKELYRGILPQAQMTQLNMTVNLRSLANFIRLRNDINAQPEIGQIAMQMAEAVSFVCPEAYMALENSGWRI